jgi:hypothetical protein
LKTETVLGMLCIWKQTQSRWNHQSNFAPIWRVRQEGKEDRATHIPQFAFVIFSKSLVERIVKVGLLHTSTIEKGFLPEFAKVLRNVGEGMQPRIFSQPLSGRLSPIARQKWKGRV